MGAAPTSANEDARLITLRQLAILDTPAEKVFDDIVRLACELAHVPYRCAPRKDRLRQIRWSRTCSTMRFATTGSNIAVRTRRDGSDEAQGGGLAVEETDGGRATFCDNLRGN